MVSSGQGQRALRDHLDLGLEVATDHDLWSHPVFEEVLVATGLSEWRVLIAAYTDPIDHRYPSYSSPSRVQLGHPSLRQREPDARTTRAPHA